MRYYVVSKYFDNGKVCADVVQTMDELETGCSEQARFDRYCEEFATLDEALQAKQAALNA